MVKRAAAPVRTGYLLVKLGDLLRAKADAALAVLDLNARKYNLLMMIAADASLSQQNLSDLLDLDPNIVGAVVDELETAGFLVRVRNPNDRRRHILHMSEAGSRRLRQADDLVKGVEEDVFGPLSRAQIASLGEAAAKALAPHWPLERRK